jgi:small GTP-binding protein
MGKPPVLKVVIAGDENVGKTSLVRRYCEGKFEASRVATIGVDFQIKLVELPGGPVKLSIWDMAGQERFEVVRGGFYRGSLATALVYDVTNIGSVKNLDKWRQEIVEVTPNQHFVIIGNKIDLKRVVSPDVPHAYAVKLKSPYLETSALTGEGVVEMFDTVAKLAASHLPDHASDFLD